MKKFTGIAFMLAGLILLTGAGVLTVSNIRRQEAAGDEAAQVLEVLREKIEARAEKEPVPDQSLPEPLRTMPTVEIDGAAYIGALEIPSLGLQLPVIGDRNDGSLEIAPCLYDGSVYSDDMVICAHNYYTHFGRLKELEAGDEILFYTADGQMYCYTVGEIETLTPADVDYMTDGEWPLTLFTCTWDGQSRVTVRCESSSSAVR